MYFDCNGEYGGGENSNEKNASWSDFIVSTLPKLLMVWVWWVVNSVAFHLVEFIL